jgi:hypothetical protein
MRTPGVPPPSVDRRRTTVLLECAPENSPMVMASILDRADFEVIVCEGPKAGERCPVAAGGTCSALAHADVVVNMLGTRTPEMAEILHAVVGTRVAPGSVVTMSHRLDRHVPGVLRLGPRARAVDLIGGVRSAAAAI